MSGITVGTQNSLDLSAGDFRKVEMPITIASGGGVLVKGTVLGRITASKKFAPYADGNVDGTETAVCILGEDVDATAADVKTFAYYTGEFNEAALTGIDANGKEDLLAKCIFVKSIG